MNALNDNHDKSSINEVLYLVNDSVKILTTKIMMINTTTNPAI
jgi:hypothetical protein